MGKTGLFFQNERSLMVKFLRHNYPSSNRCFSRIYAPVHEESLLYKFCAFPLPR